MLTKGFRTRASAAVGILTALLAWIPQAMAQGTAGAFPDPLSSAQIDQFARILGIDAADRADLGPFHEAYLQRMRDLREGPIADWLKANGSGSSVMGSSRTHEELESALRSRLQILSQMERAERELLDRIAAGLPPEQSARADRVRLLAARERGRGLLGPFGGGAIVEIELRELVDGLDLEEDARASLDPVLDDHERRLTRIVEEMAQRALRQPMEMAEALAAAGVRRPSAPEPGPDGQPPAEAGGPQEALLAYLREMSRVRAQVSAPQRESRAAVAKLSRSTVARLGAALPAERAEEIFDAFVRKAYPQVAAESASAEPVLASAARIVGSGEGDPDMAEAIRVLRQDWRARYDAVRREMMDVVDAGRRFDDQFGFLGSGDGGDGGAGRQERQERLASLRDARQSINDSTVAQVQALLGPSLAQRLGARHGQGEGRAMGADVVGVMVLDGGDGIEVVDFEGGEGMMVAIGGDGFPGAGGAGPLPQAISDRDLESIIASLGVEGDLRSIVEVLHEDYRDAFERLREAIAEELAQAAPAPQAGPAGQAGAGAMPIMLPLPGDEKTIARRFAIFQGGVERLAAVDRSFFEALSGLLQGTPGAARIADAKASRERSVLDAAGRGPGAMGGMFIGGAIGGREAEVDLLELSMQLGEDRRRDAAPSLARYREEALGAARQRYETAIAAQKEIDIFHAKAMKVGRDGDVQVSIDSESDGFDRFQKAQRRIVDASARVAAINRTVRDEILAILPEGERTAFRRAYARAAWPSVHRDPADARRKVEMAIALASVDAQRKARLEELLASHVAAWEEICDRMVEVEAAAPQMGVPEPGAMREMAERQNEMRKLRFERSERNAATLRTLGTLLSPEEVQAIGGVAMPEQRRRPTFEIGR